MTKPTKTLLGLGILLMVIVIVLVSLFDIQEIIDGIAKIFSFNDEASFVVWVGLIYVFFACVHLKRNDTAARRRKYMSSTVFGFLTNIITYGTVFQLCTFMFNGLYNQIWKEEEFIKGIDITGCTLIAIAMATLFAWGFEQKIKLVRYTFGEDPSGKKTSRTPSATSN